MSDEKNKKLGKGLSSLLSGKSFSNKQETPFIDSLNSNLNIGITKVSPNPNQPRKSFNDNEIEELSNSIKEKGIIQPILVRKIENSDSYEIIAGERRWRAAQKAGLHEVPIIIKNYSDQEAIEVALIENIQRENLNPVEEAKAYYSLSSNFNYNQEEVSVKVGKSRSYITNMIRLLELQEEVLAFLISGKITVGHARALIGNSNAIEIAKTIISKKLSVRQTEKMLSVSKGSKKEGKPNLADPNINDLEVELSQKIGLKTSIAFKENSTAGSITVYYSTLEQLDDIMRRLKSKK